MSRTLCEKEFKGYWEIIFFSKNIIGSNMKNKACMASLEYLFNYFETGGVKAYELGCSHRNTGCESCLPLCPRQSQELLSLVLSF